MNILQLQTQGLIKDCTNFEGLTQTINKGQAVFYFGIDLTADGLHVGHLSGLMMARRLLKMGLKAIILLGVATTKIGDPTGKDKERPLITEQTIELNRKGIEVDVRAIFAGFDDKIEFVNNADWLLGLSYIDMLNEVGRHFTLARMLSLESVKLRLEREQSITFTEFNYSLMQGYDFYYLAKNKNCLIQLGGSDQWGNITAGTELVRKKLDVEGYGLTIPLLTTFDGKKMGKTEGGAVWLNSEKLSNFDYFQYFRNTDDRDVNKMLKTFTELDFAKIEELCAQKGSEINKVKDLLAFEATKICRGQQAANEAMQSALSLYAGHGEAVLQQITATTDEKITAILIKTATATSNSEAKKLIAGGGVSINDNKVDDINLTLSSGTHTLKVGKKKAFSVIVG